MLDARLNPFHAAAAILLVTIGTVFFPVAAVVVPLAGAAGWLSVLLAFAVALPWVFSAMWLVARAPVGDFGQAVHAWLGPWLGRLFLLYLGFIWAWLGGLLLAQSGMVTQATALPDTPQVVLNVALLLLVVLTDLRGVEVFMRTLELLLLFSTPVIAIYILIALSVVRVENLLPLFAEAPIRIAHASLLALPWVMEGILFALFACVYVNTRKNLHWLAALAITVAGLLLSLTVVLTLGVLGRSVTESFVYPTVELTQVIHIGFFLQGLEGLLYPMWAIFSYVKVTAAFVLVSESLRGIYGGFRQPFRGLAVGVLFLVISALPGSFTELVASISRVDNTFFMLMYAFLPLVCLFAYLRGRKEAKIPASARVARRH
ncbi:MAG: GerAB/ArcD/ProY family transporter [Selenomonadales bacterium]|jgi:spore germination protein KB|nr:GerAB/ArcD/ProY family transporter [Selenomonadales bacterium]